MQTVGVALAIASGVLIVFGALSLLGVVLIAATVWSGLGTKEARRRLRERLDDALGRFNEPPGGSL